MVKFFGKSPDDIPEAPPTTDPIDSLVAALTAQTAALTALVAEMQHHRNGADAPES